MVQPTGNIDHLLLLDNTSSTQYSLKIPSYFDMGRGLNGQCSISIKGPKDSVDLPEIQNCRESWITNRFIFKTSRFNFFYDLCHS